MKKLFLSICLMGLLFNAAAENLSLSGVDSSSLMQNQKVDLYMTITDSEGNALSADQQKDIRIYESPDGENYTERLDKVIESDTNLREGIHFMMLVDNSGSMYYSRDGVETDNVEDMRITHTEKALENFLNSIQNSRDQIALAAFNTRFQLMASSTGKRDTIMDAFDKMERPDDQNSYTELYAALTEAAPILGQNTRGRKVIVVLSDGENYPYYQYSGNYHPDYQEKTFLPEEAIEAMQRQGITLYAINYGASKDPNLEQMVLETGGRIFDASSSEELAGVYDFIRQSLLKELRVRYRAGIYPSEKVWVKVEIPGDSSLPRFYYNSGLFGMVSSMPLWIDLIILFLSLALWVLLMFIRLEKRRSLPNLEMIEGGLHQRVMDLTKDKTIIGGDDNHDVTIAGMPENKDNDQAATIVYDEKENKYTLIAQAETMVNNQSVKEKELQNGDVIKVGDSLIIFDGEATKIQE